MIIKTKLGNVFFSIDDHDSALELYSQVMAQQSDINNDAYAEMIYNYATIKYQEEKYDEAQLYFKDLLRCKESNNDLLSFIPDYDIAYHLGMSSYQSGFYDTAIDELSRYLPDFEKNCGSGEYDLSQVYFMLAEMYEKRGKSKDTSTVSFNHYTKYIEINDQKLLIRLKSDKCEKIMSTLILLKFWHVLEK